MPPSSDAFVGRGEELDFLHQRALEALDGAERFVVILGDQGIGKSRLIDEFFSRHGAMLRAVRIRCSPTVRDVTDVLNSLCEALADLLRKENPETLEAGRALTYARNLIRTARRSAPLAIAVEDLHFVTAAAVDALEQLAGVANLLIVSGTPDDAQVEVREALARLSLRSTYEVRLAPLPAEAMRRMIRHFQTGRGALPRQVVTQIIELADGNPSFASDLARTSAQGSGAKLCVPASVSLRARRMLDSLDVSAQQVLLVAAALGVEFDAVFLSRVADRPRADVLEVMQRALLIGLVREVRAKRFAFSHPLLREALQSKTSPSFAARYHQRAAQALERRAKSAEEFEAVAEQWRGAARSNDATLWEERAGERALRDGEFLRAAAAFRRGLSGCEDRAVCRRLRFQRAEALRRGGLEEEALLALDEYLDASDGDDAETVGKALLHKMLLLRSAGQFEASEALAQTILAFDLPEGSPVKAIALVQLAGQRFTSGRHDEARDLLERVESEYRLEDPEALGQFYHQRALLSYGKGFLDEAIDDFRKGVAHMEHSHNGPLYVQHLCNFGNVALLQARNALALEMLERACEVARTVASETKIHFALSSYARALMRVGRNAEAHAALSELGKSDADLSELNALSSAVAMIELGSMLRDPALLERALDSDALELAFQSGERQRILTLATAFASYHWHAGNEEVARELLQRALASTERVSWHYTFAVLVAQFGEMQDVPRARRMLEPPLVVGPPHVIAPFVDLFDAFVARRRGRATQAGSFGRKAAEGFAAIGWPYFEAQAREVAGDHGEALRIYDRIGDVRDAERLRSALRPPRRLGRHAVALTAREREVALLALEGLSSPDIAKRLGIGTRTVEHHLQVLYGKFGIRSRWQLPHEL